MNLTPFLDYLPPSAWNEAQVFNGKRYVRVNDDWIEREPNDDADDADDEIPF